MLQQMQKVILTTVGLCGSYLALAQANSQVPPMITKQVYDIETRFNGVLNAECPDDVCFPVGCQVGRFDVLDAKPSSSLPGLDEEAPAKEVQYRLVSASCEFTFEASLSKENVQALKKRLAEKVKMAGIAVQIIARELPSKKNEPVLPTPPLTQAKQPDLLPVSEAMLRALVPFIPWFIAGFLFLIGLLMILRMFKIKTSAQGLLNNGLTTSAKVGLTEQQFTKADPSPVMVLKRIEQLRQDLMEDALVTTHLLKRFLDDENYDDLCKILHHFGAQVVLLLADDKEYLERIHTLSEKFRNFADSDKLFDIWRFLEHLEKNLAAAKISIKHQPIEAEFSFLASISIDAFIAMLSDLPESEALFAIAYAPKSLREKFFSHASPQLTSKVIHQLTVNEKQSDRQIRDIAAKLRRHFNAADSNIKSIKVDRLPLFEQALNAVEPARRKEIVSDIQRNHPDLLDEVGPAIFLDESLLYLPTNLLDDLFLNVSPREGAAFLMQHEWASKILTKLNNRLRESISNNKPQNQVAAQQLSEVCRKKISDYLRNKAGEHNVNLREINKLIMRNT